MERNVVVAGWSQITQPKIMDSLPLDLMGLMAKTCLQAAEMLDLKAVISSLQGIMVVRSGSRHFDDPARELAEHIGATPKLCMVSEIGGNSPQTLINHAGGMIARNEIDSVLITGAECYVHRGPTRRKTKSALFDAIPDAYAGDDLIGSTPLENQHGIEHPMQGFPLFETALWARSKKELYAYLEGVGKMWSQFSTVAAGNPHAWSRQPKTWKEIITPSPSNRPIAFPYTKYMNSFVTVDQSAAIILMAEETAKKYRQKNRQTVYFTGGGYARDRQRFLIEKSDFTSSPPLKAAVDKALTRSETMLQDIESLDLYSCFPCAVSVAKKMLNISDGDPRPLTQTGGLGFFGGPGNNYNLHAVATLAEKISLGKTSNGLVTALGWFMHKHAAGVYSCRPSNRSMKNYDLEDTKNPLAGDTPVPITDKARGIGIIETYTIIYSRDQQPEYAVIYGRTKDQERFIARTRNHPDLFAQLTSECCVGKTVRLTFDTSENLTIADMN